MIFKSDIMNINFKDAVSYLSFKELDKYNFIKHGYMTRLGGVSEKEYKSLDTPLKKQTFEQRTAQ